MAAKSKTPPKRKRDPEWRVSRFKWPKLVLLGSFKAPTEAAARERAIRGYNIPDALQDRLVIQKRSF